MVKPAGLVFCIFFPYRAPDGTVLCAYLSFSPPFALILPLLSSAHPVESFARIPHVDILSTDACRICLGFARSLVWPPILLQTLSSCLLLPLVYPIFDKGWQVSSSSPSSFPSSLLSCQQSLNSYWKSIMKIACWNFSQHSQANGLSRNWGWCRLGTLSELA